MERATTSHRAVELLNRRKLIQLVLSDLRSERPYIEIKRQLDLDSERGRGALLRAVAAIGNSNPRNRSYLIIGIDERSGKVTGIPRIDDQRIQQLVREYLAPNLEVLYENIAYPTSAGEEVVGLLTIQAGDRPCLITRPIWKLNRGQEFRRFGSETREVRHDEDRTQHCYSDEVQSLELRSAVRLSDTLNEFLEFNSRARDSYHPKYAVFNDQHVVCYSGWSQDSLPIDIHSEVMVVLLTEGVDLFWSALHYVSFEVEESTFSIVEHAELFWEGNRFLLPLEKTTLRFTLDGRYGFEKELIFKTPPLSVEAGYRILESYRETLARVNTGQVIGVDEGGRLETYPYEFLLATLMGLADARRLLMTYLDGHADGSVAESWFNAKELLAKIEANSAG